MPKTIRKFSLLRVCNVIPRLVPGPHSQLFSVANVEKIGQPGDEAM